MGTHQSFTELNTQQAQKQSWKILPRYFNLAMDGYVTVAMDMCPMYILYCAWDLMMFMIQVKRTGFIAGP